MKNVIALFATAWISIAMASDTMGRPGSAARYRIEQTGALRPSVVKSFALSTGAGWTHLSATKANQQRFDVWLRGEGYPSPGIEQARLKISRYILQEGSAPAREYRNALTGEAVLPAMGGWE